MNKAWQLQRLSTERTALWWPRIIARLVCWRARAEERRLLAALDQRELTDIGISRLDALRECAKPFWRA